MQAKRNCITSTNSLLHNHDFFLRFPHKVLLSSTIKNKIVLAVCNIFGTYSTLQDDLINSNQTFVIIILQLASIDDSKRAFISCAVFTFCIPEKLNGKYIFYEINNLGYSPWPRDYNHEERRRQNICFSIQLHE